MRPRSKELETHLSPREIAICLRLQKARITLGLTQEKCAHEIGIPKARLANCELCRAALKADVATVFCYKFFFNEMWLATGKGEPQIHLFLRFTREYANVPPGAKFSEAFDKHLSTIARQRDQAFSPEFLIDVLQHFREHPDECFFSYAMQAMSKHLMFSSLDPAWVCAKMIAAGVQAQTEVREDARRQVADAKERTAYKPAKAA